MASFQQLAHQYLADDSISWLCKFLNQVKYTYNIYSIRRAVRVGSNKDIIETRI